MAGSLWGTLAFASVLVFPGYGVGFVTNLMGFRERSGREQLAWSVALSFGVGTVLVLASTWLLGLQWTAILLGLNAVGVAFVMSRRRTWPAADWKSVSVVCVWVVVALLSLVDLGHGRQLWMSVTTFDHSLRVTLVDAVMRTGVPPVDPVFWPGHTVTLRYYYFWYVNCAVVAKLAHISARQALMASCVWPLVGVWAMLALLGKYLLGWSGDVLRRQTWLAVAMLSITGLDVLVTMAFHFMGEQAFADMEWWSIDQVTSWLDSFLWVPHHVAALICCLLCLLLAWLGSRASTWRESLKAGVLLGLTYAGMFGLSIYIAIASALVLAVWLVQRLFTAERRQALTTLVVATLVAGLTLIPFLLQLLHTAAKGKSTTQHPLGFGVRQILDPAILLGLPGFRWVAEHHSFAATQISAAILLMPGYAVEFGFFAVVAFFSMRKRAFTDGERTLRFWFWAGLAAASFLRSTVITNNDYGIRAALVPQALLLLLAVPVVLEAQTAGGWRRRLLVAAAVVGVAGSAYQLVLLRVYLPFQQLHGNAAYAEVSEKSYALRDAYTAMQALGPSVAPHDALLQYDTNAGVFVVDIHELDANRSIVNSENPCNDKFGGERTACAAIYENVWALFPEKVRQATLGAGAARAVCGALGARILVATRWDPVWQDRGSWVWSLPSLVTNPDVRIVDCIQ